MSTRAARARRASRELVRRRSSATARRTGFMPAAASRPKVRPRGSRGVRRWRQGGGGSGEDDDDEAALREAMAGLEPGRGITAVPLRSGEDEHADVRVQGAE